MGGPCVRNTPVTSRSRLTCNCSEMTNTHRSCSLFPSLSLLTSPLKPPTQTRPALYCKSIDLLIRTVLENPLFTILVEQL